MAPRIRGSTGYTPDDARVRQLLGLPPEEKFVVDGLHNRPPSQAKLDDLPASNGHRMKLHRDGQVPGYFPGENTQQGLDRWSQRSASNSYHHKPTDFPAIGAGTARIERARTDQTNRMEKLRGESDTGGQRIADYDE